MNILAKTAALVIVVSIWAADLPKAKILYRSDEMFVVSRESQDTIEFAIRMPASLHLTIIVDRNQNGKVDSRVDTLYALKGDGDFCPAFLLGEDGSTTFCGEFHTAAVVSGDTIPGGDGYFISVPKAELSDGQQSASLLLEFWNSSSHMRTFYPSSSFKKPLVIEYEIY